MISVKKISHACYETPDLDLQVEYFTEVLGLALISRSADEVFLGGTIDHHSVVLRRAAKSECSRLGFQIGADDDLDEFERQLQSHGIDTVRKSDPEPGIAHELTFVDPKGTTIEVFHAQPVTGRRFTEKGINPNKLGHVAFHVPDAVAMTDFYCDVLGFRVSDWLERRFSFLRCSKDHHTVNFIGSGSVRHDHTAFELRDWSHIEYACDYLSRSGYRLIWGPGRHGIGHNLFTYHKNPDGLIIELFAELDTISNESLGYFDPKPWHPDSPQYPKTWELKPGLVNLWRDEAPPVEMLEV